MLTKYACCTVHAQIQHPLTPHKIYTEQEFLAQGCIQGKPYEIAFNRERAAYVAAGPYSSIVVTQSGLVYSMGFGTAISLTQPTYRMAACGCSATNLHSRENCQDPYGHGIERERGPRAFGPVFACPLDHEQAQDQRQERVNKKFMALGQLYTPDIHGRRMLVPTTCISTSQTCSFTAPSLLAFLMGTKPQLCGNVYSVLPDIPAEVW